MFAGICKIHYTLQKNAFIFENQSTINSGPKWSKYCKTRDVTEGNGRGRFLIQLFGYNKSCLANHFWDLRDLRRFHILVLFTYCFLIGLWLVSKWCSIWITVNQTPLAQIWTHWSIYTIWGGCMFCLQWVVFASSMRWWKNVLMGFEFDVDWSVGERESCGAIRSR